MISRLPCLLILQTLLANDFSVMRKTIPDFRLKILQGTLGRVRFIQGLPGVQLGQVTFLFGVLDLSRDVLDPRKSRCGFGIFNVERLLHQLLITFGLVTVLHTHGPRYSAPENNLSRHLDGMTRETFRAPD